MIDVLLLDWWPAAPTYGLEPITTIEEGLGKEVPDPAPTVISGLISGYGCDGIEMRLL